MGKAEPKTRFEIFTSRNFPSWLNLQRISLAFTTYQVGKIFMMGINPNGKLHVSERTFNRCMGLGGNSHTLWMSTRFQMWRFENSLLSSQSYKGYDRVYIPQMAYTTGDLDIHDIALRKDGFPIFVNTQFNCLATLSETHSFKPIWKPNFITDLVPEDRCHLNGMAMFKGEPAYVTAVSQSNVSDGWRDHRESGGVVIETRTNEIICKGLSMPHSPRLYKDKLWLLEAGSGFFGYVELGKGKFHRVTFCPGFLRGLSFVGNYALVGLSSVRENKTFSGLELDYNLEKNKAKPRCGIQVININTGAVEEWVRIEGIVNELYDVLVIPETRRPLLIGTQKEEIHKMISIEPR